MSGGHGHIDGSNKKIALLVAIPQSPESRRPDRAADRAEAARSRVLARAVKEGVIDAEEAEAARREEVPGLRKPFPALAPHLADRAKADLPTVLSHHLTLDGGLQRKLEALALEAVEGKGERLQVAILVADHASGEILASVGSAGYQADLRQGFVDMTQALRSPGSTLKPLVYALAFDEGLGHPETMIDDKPMSFGAYAPQNFDKLYMGTIRMREALQLSRNIPVVERVGLLTPLLSDPARSVRQVAAIEIAGAGVAALPAADDPKYRAALTEYLNSRLANADTPEGHMALGGLALSRRQWDEAETAFRTAAEMDPQLVQAWLVLSQIREARGDKPQGYDPGSSGPEDALMLMHRDGRRWREIRE